MAIGARALDEVSAAQASLREAVASANADEAIEMLHRRFAEDLTGFVTRRVSDPYLAQDIVQETFIRAYKSIDTLDPDRPVWPWLSVIATRLCINAVRDRKRAAQASLRRAREVDEPGGARSPDMDPETYLRNRERRAAISEAFDTLGPYQRRLLMLKHQRGWSYAQIAALESVTLDAVKSTLKRARHAFRKAYSTIATERGLNVLTWPVVAPAIRRMRSTRDRIRSDLASAVQFGRTLNIPLDAAASFAVATVVAGVLIVGGVRAMSGPSAEVGATAEGSESSARVEGDASVDTAATPPVSAGASAEGTGDGSGAYTAASASLSAPPLADEDPAATADASGEVESDHPDKRTFRVRFSHMILGEEELGEAYVEVPCNSFGPDQYVCDAIDLVTEEEPPYGSDDPPPAG